MRIKPGEKLTIEEVQSHLEWLARNHATLTFRHDDGKTYAEVTVTEGDERIAVSACVNNRDGGGEIMERTMLVIGLCEAAERDLGRIPF